MRYVADSIRIFLDRVLAVASSDEIEWVYLSLLELGGVLGNLGLYFRYNFLDFSLSCNDATDPTSLMFIIVEILNLNGFSVDSIPAMPLLSFSLFGRVMCLGRTVSSSITMLYWLTSDISSAVSNLEMMSSCLRSVIMALS